jgi:hypothetical protein
MAFWPRPDSYILRGCVLWRGMCIIMLGVGLAPQQELGLWDPDDQVQFIPD